ncbi:MAG TPA: phosphate signaling complex protein PhoU [Chloroflexota bacterium]|jgi:phosphate transport system protein|nr:phosphate signaling complex protein PhoU [Chloroflexota bacterium]
MDPRATYHEALRALQDQMLALARLVEQAIDRAIAALKARDAELARQVVAEDVLIDRRRYEIEERVVTLIATQQPTAGDLRTILAILHITIELERMGDYAEGIAKIAEQLADQPLLKPLIDIPRMAEQVRSMLRRSLEAFLARDAGAARAIAREDDQIDALKEQVYRELLTYMIEDPSTITRATYLIWVTHNLERMADRVTNICERIVFLVTGRLEETPAPAP